MDLRPYTLDELRCAYCCHVYYRWQSYRRRSTPMFRDLVASDFELRYPEIHVLNIEATDRELAVLASLRPAESIASAASKLKGATSAFLRERMRLDHPQKLLAGGYFACTSGASTSETLDRYLDNQAAHHGYTSRQAELVWVHMWPTTLNDWKLLQANHSATRVRWHLVLSTWNRVDLFTSSAAEAVSSRWEVIAGGLRARLLKVSWVPDHVHVALASHPSLVPIELVLAFLNESQALMASQFNSWLLHADSQRLWKPGAYVGTYGDLATPQIQAYLRNWRAGNES
jgi:REP element-mobilizing transposase RayT